MVSAQYLINIDDISIEGRRRYRTQALDALKARTTARLGVSEEQLQVMELCPEDLGLLSWDTGLVRMVGRFPWVKTTIKSNVHIAIYKIMSLSVYPGVTSIDISRGATRMAHFELAACYSGLPTIERILEFFQDPTTKEVIDRIMDRPPEQRGLNLGSRCEAYLSETLVFDSNDSISIDVTANKEGTSGDILILGGYRTELRGTTVA